MTYGSYHPLWMSTEGSMSVKDVAREKTLVTISGTPSSPLALDDLATGADGQPLNRLNPQWILTNIEAIPYRLGGWYQYNHLLATGVGEEEQTSATLFDSLVLEQYNGIFTLLNPTIGNAYLSWIDNRDMWRNGLLDEWWRSADPTIGTLGDCHVYREQTWPLYTIFTRRTAIQFDISGISIPSGSSLIGGYISITKAPASTSRCFNIGLFGDTETNNYDFTVRGQIFGSATVYDDFDNGIMRNADAKATWTNNGTNTQEVFTLTSKVIGYISYILTDTPKKLTFLFTHIEDDTTEFTGSGNGIYQIERTGCTKYYIMSASITLVFGTLKPTVISYAAFSISTETAYSQGDVTDAGGATITSRGFVYKTNTGQDPTILDAMVVSGSGTGFFSAQMTGLIPSTSYKFCAFATSSAGTSYSSVRTFTTTAASLPTLSTTSISSIQQTTATGGGNITSNGGATITSRGICWVVYSAGYVPTIADSVDYSGSGSGSYTSYLINLTAGTQYRVRAFAVNSVGISYGDTQIFTSSSGTVYTPTLTTVSVTNIEENTAQSGGSSLDDRGYSITAKGCVWCQYMLGHPNIHQHSHTTDGTGTAAFISYLTSLADSTEYNVCAYATNSQGTGYGNVLSFTTDGDYAPTVTSNTVTSISDTSALCGGNVTSDGGASVTERGCCWIRQDAWRDPDYGDSRSSNGTGTGTFTSSISPLSNSTTYLVRAYAKNSVGISYGVVQTFTTLTDIPD